MKRVKKIRVSDRILYLLEDWVYILVTLFSLKALEATTYQDIEPIDCFTASATETLIYF
jgi:hypothetical protein